MFLQISRGVTLVTLALWFASWLPGCASGDVASDETIAQVSQAQVESCKCVNAQGKPAEMKCYDSCFKAGANKCGEANEPCVSVCKFGAMTSEPRADCEAALPNGDGYRGVCADQGVTPDGRSGCCPGCLLQVGKEYVCGAPNDPKACGGVGGSCDVCKDEKPDDCLNPLCENGKCSGAYEPAPVGQVCSTDSGTAGHCATKGVCCDGCITPSGACFKGEDPGACGVGGRACVNCDDNLACNGREACKAGKCVDGLELNCDDGNVCTKDGCDEATGCTHVVDEGAGCSDGNGCTVNDKCNSNGACKGTPKVCDDGNDCTSDSCNAGTCEFEPVADDTTCDDGSSCTTDTTCQSGVCTANGDVTCHDTSNPCVTSSCGSSGTGACQEVNRPDDTPCDDGDPCTTNDACQSGQCVGGGDTDCDDNNDCTDDACDPDSGCVHDNASGECADGDLCTVNDRCQNGTCTGDPVECAASNECHAEGECDAESGLCSVLFQPDGTECGNSGECEGGACDGQTIPMAAGGTGGAAGAGGTAGESGEAGSGGSAGESPGSGGSGTGGSGKGGSGTGGDNGIGGAAGSGGVGGTFSGDSFVRDPKGCDCRTAPGGSEGIPHGGFALFGLFAVAGVRTRRRRRSRR